MSTSGADKGRDGYLNYRVQNGAVHRLLSRARLRALVAADGMGVTRRVARSEWRRRRHLILCYHGVSIDDEHRWSPLYVSQALLIRRVEWLLQNGYSILSLADALERVRHGDLPPASVSITFDDGAYDFAAKAEPVLVDAGVPATLYLTTHYVERGGPVFDTMMSYLLWKGAGRPFRSRLLGEGTITAPAPDMVAAREDIALELKTAAGRAGMSTAEKHGLLEDVARQLCVDFEGLCERRILHLLAPAEVAALHPTLIDVQLHTHRHQTPKDLVALRAELEDNRAAIARMRAGARSLVHFCYPSGWHGHWMIPVFEEAGLVSATTCQPGLVSRESPRFFLPRFLDCEDVSDGVFSAWASGIAALSAQRPTGAST